LDVVKKLKQEGVIIASIEQAVGAIMLQNLRPEADKKVALVFGNEVKGVDQKVVNASDMVIEIPQFGSKHSLNISVSVGMVVWDLFSKMTYR